MTVGLFDRLGDVLRSYLRDGDDWSEVKTSQGGYFSDDPDVSRAFDELDDFLKGKSPNTERGGAGYGKTSDWGTPRTGNRTSKPSVPEVLRDDFAELGLEFGADADKCKAAHKQLLKIHHPDHHASHEGNMKKATIKSAKINAAYERICKWRETGKI
ncbi:MAG: J domain-containing protein [Treponema sp.]|jgi:DnaJ-domain-containing protein 1|nr:J domain-containing protein [Treponema sp.]